MLIKLGEAVVIRPEDIQPIDKLASDIDLGIEDRMRKFAQELKVIAPQAKDFLYFTAVMMHAAEAACINDDGTPKKLSNGEDVSATWDKVGEGIRWVCNDPRIQPYRNNNRDIFPEAELKLAYKNWVGRPLCLDHQSQSVDKIRGVIVDTVYDDRRKRVIALCALDAKNYGDLADKVKTGVANNVSMGTAVGRAVCTDCGTVAKAERDFCHHMRTKSCYGEINLDLAPIELSLVVSGADPKAKVKHIIASDIEKAAVLLTDYLQIKEAAKEVSTQDLESIKKDLASLTQRIQTIAGEEIASNKDDESDAVGPTHSRWSMESEVSHNPSTQVNAPEAFPTYASELQQAILGARTKLASLQENIQRLSTSTEEPTMTKKEAYFQGTEEPKPGQKQYPVDPMNEKTRLMDKNLHGPAPFPGVGDIDGSYPGDEQTKKELQRLADEHERAMFREAALKKAKEQLKSKEAYFQGTEDPKPGQTAYTPDPLNEKARLEDKNLHGPAPFPGVGDVEGLYGDDMKVKEMLARASLRARFEKSAQPDGRINKAACRWIVLANEKPILAATVDQITKGNTDALYDAVATERFGKSLLSRIQSEGFHATASALLNKSAQAPMPAAPPMSVAPPAAEGAPPADMGALEPPENVGGDVGSEDDIIDDLQSLIDEMEGKISDLQDKVSGPVAEDAEGMEGIAPAGDEEFAPMEGGAPKSASQLQGMRKRVNAMLQEGIQETITALAKHVHELKSAKRVYKEAYASMTEEQRDTVNGLAVDAVKDARAMLGDTGKLMDSVVKYAYATAELEKRASASTKKAKSKVVVSSGIESEIYAFIESIAKKAAKKDDKKEDKKEDKKDKKDDKKDKKDKKEEGKKKASEEDSDDLDVVTESGDRVGELKDGKVVASKRERAAARVKLAQQGLLGFNDLSDQAHPGGSVDAVEAGNLDVKPNVPGSAFHVYKDLKQDMMEFANMPPRVRKQAEMIQQLVSEGRMRVEDVDQLVSHNVDPDAVKYWKAMWGEAKDSESSEFATKLTQEHAQAKQAEDVEAYKGQIKRAYELANQMVVKGLISEAQVDSQVGDIMKWNDAGFESFKRMLDKQASISKKASVPSVGLLDSGQVILPAAHQPVQAGGADIKGFFDSYFNQKGLKF